MITGPEIAIGAKGDKKVSIWCQIKSVTDDEVHFHVNNGVWSGIYYPENQTVRVNFTGQVYPAVILWEGESPHRHYYDAIRWINEQIKKEDEE